MYIVFLILPLSARCLILNWIPSGSVLASWLLPSSFLLFLSFSSSSFTFFSSLLSWLSLLTSFRSSSVSFFLSLPTFYSARSVLCLRVRASMCKSRAPILRRQSLLEDLSYFTPIMKVRLHIVFSFFAQRFRHKCVYACSLTKRNTGAGQWTGIMFF